MVQACSSQSLVLISLYVSAMSIVCEPYQWDLRTRPPFFTVTVDVRLRIARLWPKRHSCCKRRPSVLLHEGSAWRCLVEGPNCEGSTTWVTSRSRSNAKEPSERKNIMTFHYVSVEAISISHHFTMCRNHLTIDWVFMFIHLSFTVFVRRLPATLDVTARFW